MRKRWPSWPVRVGVVLLLLVVSGSVTHALQHTEGDTVSIGSGEVVDDDLYVVAETFTLDGTITGDLYVAGKTVSINGVVEGDIVAAGQTITLNGTANDDVRVAAAAVFLGPRAAIADDLIAATYSLEQQPKSHIGGNLLLASKQALLSGQIGQDVLAAVAGLDIQGQIGGNVQVEVGTLEDEPSNQPLSNVLKLFPDFPSIPVVPNGLLLGGDARIGGNLSYRSEREMNVSAEQVGGKISYTPVDGTMDQKKQKHAGDVVGRFIYLVRRVVVLFLLGSLIAWLTPRFFYRLTGRVQEQPLTTLGWGIVVFLSLIAAMVVAIVLFGLLAIILGRPFLLVGFATLMGGILGFLVVASYLSKIIVGYVGGKLLVVRIRPDLVEQPWWALLVGLILIVLFLAIPILGNILNVLTVVAGFGALWLTVREMRLHPSG